MSSMNKELSALPVVEYSFFEGIKDQYFYKLNAYHSMFGTMIIMQGIALILTFIGQSVGVGSNNVFVQINIFSADIVISISIVWAFMMAIILTNKASKNMMATFVTDKRTNHISNMLFMITLSIIGGITSFLLGFFIKMAVYVLYRQDQHIYFETITIGEVFIGIIATIFYILLLFAIGYLLGELIQVHRSLTIIVTTLIIGMYIFLGITIVPIISFYTAETNLLFFICKVLFTVVFLFFLSSFVGKRLEVRKT